MNDLKRIRLLQQDIYDDVKALDGTPVTAKNLGQTFGHIYAALDCLAAVLENLLVEKEIEP